MDIKALNIAIKIKFKELLKSLPYECISNTNMEAIFKLAEDKFIIFYSFGVFNLINMNPTETKLFMDFIETIMPGCISNREVEDKFEVKIQENTSISVSYNHAVIPEFKLEYLKIISLIIAESVSLDYFEKITEEILDKSLLYSKKLQANGTYPSNHRDLLKFIGFVTATRQEILSNLYISDSPDETWDNQTLGKLFKEMRDMFDLEPRFRSINLSLNSIQENIEILVDLIQAKKSHTTEWLIIGLIAFEIIMSLFEKIVK